MPTIVYSKIMIDYFFCYNKAVLEAERMFTFIDKAGRNIAKRILGKIEELSKDPFPRQASKVQGEKENVYRVRVSKYRILYIVFRDQSLIAITDIDNRGRIYE